MSVPAILNKSIRFHEESEDEMLARYHGFGINVYEALFQMAPWIRPGFRYFRTDFSCDVWSVCTMDEFEFGMQLEPYTECICIWDAEWHDEIGDWIDDPIALVLETISKRYLRICS